MSFRPTGVPTRIEANIKLKIREVPVQTGVKLCIQASSWLCLLPNGATYSNDWAGQLTWGRSQNYRYVPALMYSSARVLPKSCDNLFEFSVVARHSNAR